jgi:hypothetical protein
MEARELQTSRKLKDALERVEQALHEYPNEIRLCQLGNTLRAALDPHFPDQYRKPQFRIPKADESQSQLKATDILSPHTDKEPVIPRPLSDPRIDASPSALRRRPTRTADGSLPDGFSFWTKLVTVAVALVLIGIGILLSSRRRLPESSKPVVDLRPPVKLQPPSGPDASQRTTEPAAASQIEDTPKSTPPPPPSIQRPQSGKVAALVSFHFGSNPSPARVVVDNDDRLTCLTPCELPLPRGRHTFLISAPGYDPVHRIVEVPEDTSAFAPLTEELKTVRVISLPPGLPLFVDGEPKGQTPTTLRLALGPHKFRIAKDDVSKEQTIDVIPETFNVQITLNAGAQ